MESLDDQQLRRHIEWVLHMDLTPQEIIEGFVKLTLCCGYIHSRTATRVSRSVFTEHGGVNEGPFG